MVTHFQPYARQRGKTLTPARSIKDLLLFSTKILYLTKKIDRRIEKSFAKTPDFKRYNFAFQTFINDFTHTTKLFGLRAE